MDYKNCHSLERNKIEDLDLKKVLHRSVTVRYFVERLTKKIWVHLTAHKSLDTKTIIRRAGGGEWLINVFNQRFVIPKI